VLVRVVAAATGSSFRASYVSLLVLITVADVVVLTIVLGRHLESATRGLLAATVGVLAILLLQDEEWLHLWDLLDVMFGALLAHFIFTQASLTAFSILFAAQMTNRESALFVALWLVLSALPFGRRTSRAVDSRRLLFGASLLAAGLATLTVARRLLFHGPPAPRRRPVTPWGNHFTLRHNAFDFVHTVRTLDWASLAVYASLIAVLVFVIRTRRRLPAHAEQVPILLLAMAGSVPFFGVVLETRSFLGFVPLVLFATFREAPAASS
jgi:hypothetical protein